MQSLLYPAYTANINLSCIVNILCAYYHTYIPTKASICVVPLLQYVSFENVHFFECSSLQYNNFIWVYSVGLSCGRTINDNSHVAPLLFRDFDVCRALFYSWLQWNIPYSVFAVVWLLMFNTHQCTSIRDHFSSARLCICHAVCVRARACVDI